jgi:putative transposase
LYAVLHQLTVQNRCLLLTIGGTEDHVHLLIRAHSTTRVSELVKVLKGASSQFGMQRANFFKWRPTYSVFLVSRWDIEKLKTYIQLQKQHHAENMTVDILESLDDNQLNKRRKLKSRLKRLPKPFKMGG